MVECVEAEQWFSGYEETCKQVADVNGPIAEAVAEFIGFEDKGAIRSRRQGAQIVGVLPCTGLGTPVDHPEPATVEGLKAGCRTHDGALLLTLKPDKHGQELQTKSRPRASKDA